VFSTFRGDVMLEQKGGLRKREKKNHGHDAPDLERHPGRGGGVAPYRLVERRQDQKEHTPAPGKAAPTFFGEVEGFGEDVFYEKSIERQTAQERDAEDGVEHGRLHLDEDIVLQIEREAAEDHHQHGGDERNGR